MTKHSPRCSALRRGIFSLGRYQVLHAQSGSEESRLEVQEFIGYVLAQQAESGVFVVKTQVVMPETITRSNLDRVATPSSFDLSDVSERGRSDAKGD